MDEILDRHQIVKLINRNLKEPKTFDEIIPYVDQFMLLADPSILEDLDEWDAAEEIIEIAGWETKE